MNNNIKTTKKYILNKLKTCENYDKEKLICEELPIDFNLNFIISFELPHIDLLKLITFCNLNGFIIGFTKNIIKIIVYII